MPEGFRFRHTVEVRYRDLDPAGHVHHTLAAIYFEEARAAYWREVAGRPGIGDVDYVLAELTMRYHQRIRYPQTVEVRARVTRLGGKSWTMAYELRSAAGELLASGESVQVAYDYAAATSVPIAPEVRARVMAYEDLHS
jgi:acyl-CoA thioester hydrolase